jgi:hypothetical protein
VIIRWRGDQALADREGVAGVFRVSARTVRRYCTPVDYDGPTRRALYDVLACEEILADVIPRPERTAQAQERRRRFLAARRGAR